jgi:hypothetical protein
MQTRVQIAKQGAGPKFCRAVIAGIALAIPMSLAEPLFLSRTAAAQEEGKFVDLTSKEERDKGNKPFDLSSTQRSACTNTPELVSKAARKKICVSVTGGEAYWREYSLELYKCTAADNKTIYFRVVTGFRTTAKPCTEEEFRQTVKDGEKFGETWPDHFPKKDEKKSDQPGGGVRMGPPSFPHWGGGGR